MNKYINAEELVEQLEIFRDTKKKTKYVQGVNAMIDAAEMVIHNLTLGEEETSVPSANVEEVKHGEQATVCDELNLLDFQPSADVVEVKHGEWKDGSRNGYNGTFWYIYCSECLYERDDDNHDNDTPYCPNCGTEMRGEENDCNK